MTAPSDFKPLFAPKTERPRAAMLAGKFGTFNLLRDQLTISTWLSVGAIAQGALVLLFGRLALLPALALVLYRTLDAYAQAVGWKHNTFMDGIVMNKMSAQFADESGEYGSTPARDDIVVFLIGTRCNHPLGVLAPNVKKLGDYFIDMTKACEQHAEEFGFLGCTSWSNNSDRAAKNELLVVMYFKTPEGLHNFAHSPHHRQGWQWFNKVAKESPHLSIYHETYHVPAGHYETIYGQSHISGILSTTTKFTDPQTGEQKWASPVVDASKGQLATSKGRMNRSKGHEHDDYEKSGYAA